MDLITEASGKSGEPISAGRHKLDQLCQEPALPASIPASVPASVKDAVVDASTDPVFVLNPDGSISMANPAALRLFGFEEPDLLGRDFCEKILSPNCRESFYLSFNRLVTTETGPIAKKRIEIVAIRADRTEISVELLVKPVRVASHENGANLYIVFMRDTSESRKTESLLRESESRFRRIFESNVTPIFFWDFQGAIQEANDAFLSLCGYSRKDLFGGALKWTDLISPVAEGGVRQLTQELQHKGVCGPIEIHYLHKTGKRIPVLVNLAILENSRNRGVSIVVDIGPQNAKTRALKKTNAALTAVLERVPFPAYYKDAQLRFEIINSACSELLSRSREEILGKTTTELGLRNADVSRATDEKILLTGEGSSTEFVTGYRGRDQLVRSEKFPLRDPDGRINGIVGVIHDLTSAKQLEAELGNALLERELISESVQELVLIHDPAGKTTFSNRNAVAAFGETDLEALEKRFLWLGLDGSPLAREKRPERQALAGRPESQAVVQLRSTSESSEDRWLIQTSRSLRNDAGDLVGVISVFRDLTELRRLEDSNQQLNAAIRALPDGIAIHDAKGDFLLANDVYASVFGYSSQEVLGHSWKALFGTEWRTVGRWRGRLRARKKCGAAIDVEISLSDLGNNRYVAHARDVTEQAHSEALGNLLRTASSLLDTTDDLQAVAEVLCVDGFADWCRIELEGSAQFGRECPNAAAEGIISIPIVVGEKKQGEIRVGRASPRAFELRDGIIVEEIARKLASWLEHARLRKEFKKLLSNQEDLLRLIGHDLVNPLCAILLNAAHLNRELGKAPELTEREKGIQVQAQTLMRAANRMNQQLRDFLDLAKKGC